jgi:hypothetical protein
VTIGRLKRIVGASLLIAFAASCGLKDKPIPTEPKARSDFLNAAAAKLTSEDRNLLNRFVARLEAQIAAGGPAVDITVPRALTLERSYESQLTDTQRNFQKLLEAANAALAIDVRDATVVTDENARQSGDKALRFVLDITNRGQHPVEQLALRVEFRDPSGKYQAAIPDLQLSGVVPPGQAGRSVQTLPLSAQRHQYILEGKPLQISAYPTRIVYAGGESLEPGKEMRTLESLHRAKIE